MMYWIEVVKWRIAKIAYSIFLWASNQTNDEFKTMLLEEAAREIESERKTRGYTL